MKTALLNLLALALLWVNCAYADSVIVGTLTVTNAVNITGTNGEALTINGDTRTWTNAVHTPATQILRNTNNAAAAQAIIIQTVGYPLAGNLVLTYPSANAVQWTAPLNAALVISLTRTNWGTVSYVTNSVGTSTVVRVPYTLESLVGQTNVASGLMDAIASDQDTNSLPAWKLRAPVVITNLTTAANFVITGTDTTQNKSQLLSLGTNVLASGDHSMFVLLSPTNDASQVILSLNHGTNSSQRLTLVNYTNALNTGAFTLPNGSAIADAAGHVRLGSDWVSTNGYVLELLFESPDWIEKGRWTLGGSGGDQNWVRFVSGGTTNLQPVDLTLPLNVGTNLNVSGNQITMFSQLTLSAGSGFNQLGGSVPLLLGTATDTVAIDTRVYPTASLMPLGYQGNPWGPLTIGGMADNGSGNFSLHQMSHTGTNGVVLFNSISGGTAGPPRPFLFQFGSTNGLTINPDSSISTAANTNRWQFLGITFGATTNITININGTNYSFIAF